jgi:hypothetical protein
VVPALPIAVCAGKPAGDGIEFVPMGPETLAWDVSLLEVGLDEDGLQAPHKMATTLR